MSAASSGADRRFARELFARYPGTLDMPWTPLADLPTPVADLPMVASASGAGSVWMKDDGLSGAPYGGNKVRKLEFLLGEALACGASDIVTFGAAGSNHALATAVYGARLGLKVHSMLLPQPNARYVRRNLLAAAAWGADLHHFPDRAHMMRGAAALRRRLRERAGRDPYVIPFGGTTPLSTAGFVSAGLELATQVEYRELPRPERVFVAIGSMGTAAGLALGMRAAGMATRLVGVPVLSCEAGTPEALLALVRQTQELIRSFDATFPAPNWDEGDFDIAEGYLGEGYALFTTEGAAAVRLAEESGVRLEGTYTGKTLAALIGWGRHGRLTGGDVLFWDTYDGRDTEALLAGSASGGVPSRLRGYFTSEVQPLDREKE